jgi:inner membrane transporter RhtA
VPPQLLVLLSALSMQVGAAFATRVFAIVGTNGAVFLRVGFAAIFLVLLWRPRLRGYTFADYISAVLFGLAIVCMNAFFYAAIARIPLGMAVTLEFVGPLGVSLASSRRLLDICWVALAACGILLLAPIGGVVIDPLGALLALLAGACWAAYILLNVRVGRSFPGGIGLALGMSVGALAFLPFGLPSVLAAWRNPTVWLVGIGIALFSTVLPFSFEVEALRRLPARVFGILMSLEPGVAALVGWLLLGENIGWRGLVAMVLIVLASGGVSLGDRRV